MNAYPIPYKRTSNHPLKYAIQEMTGVTYLFPNCLNWQERIHATQYLHNGTPQDWVYVINASAFRTGKAIDGNVFGFVRTPRLNEDYIRVPYFARPSSLGGWSHDKRGNRQTGCTEIYIFDDESVVLWHKNIPFQFSIMDLEPDVWTSILYIAFLNYKIETCVYDPKHDAVRDFCEDWGITKRTRFVRAY